VLAVVGLALYVHLRRTLPLARARRDGSSLPESVRLVRVGAPVAAYPNGTSDGSTVSETARP
jgi:hypothetical protein